MKATSLKKPTPVNVGLRRRAEQRLRAEPPPGESSSGQDLPSTVAELRIYEAELEIQNEELLDSRAQIEDSQQKYFRHFDLAPVGLIRLNRDGLILEANILAAQMLDEKRVLLNTVPRTFLAHVAPDSLPLFEQHRESALASGKMETCELSLRTAAGHETFVRMQSVISRNEKDEMILVKAYLVLKPKKAVVVLAVGKETRDKEYAATIRKVLESLTWK